MRRWLQILLRWALRAVCGALLVVLIVAAAACAYLSTEHGKARLLRAVVANVDGVLPGTIMAEELSRLTPTAVELRGLSLRAPAGNEVARVQKVRARLAPWSLLEGRIALEALVLENAAVDLHAIDDPRVGLLSALVEPSAGEEPEADTPLDIRFDGLRIENCRARLPAAFDAAPDELWLTTLDGRLGIGAEVQLDVQQLRARVLRQNVDLGGVRVSGRLHTLGRSQVTLAGTLGGVELDVDLAQGEAGRPLSAWESSPLVLELGLQGLTAERLAALTGSTAPQLDGAFGARLLLHGTPAVFEADGTLQTPGGAIAFNGRGRGLARLELAAQLERFALGRLGSSLPDRSISAQLAVGLERLAGNGPELRASLSASTRVDDVALPRISLAAELTRGSPWQLALELDDRWLQLRAEGQVAPDGALRAGVRGWLSPVPGLELARALGYPLDSALPEPSRPAGDKDRLDLRVDLARSAAGALDASATLGAARLSLGGGRIEQLAATLSLAGQLPRPRVKLSARWQAALLGSAELTAGRIELEGGPNRYRLDLRGGSHGLQASGWAEREGAGQRFALNARGRYRGAPWRIDVQPALLLDSGHVTLPGVDVELSEQHLHLSGRYAGTASRLVVELDDVDVQRVLEPFLPETKLAGVLGGRIEAHGALERPALSVSLHGSRLGVVGTPTFDASVDAALAQDGNLTLDVQAREHAKGTARRSPRLDMRVTGSGDLDTRKPWPAIIATGEQELTLTLARLDSSLLDELVGAPAPASLDGRGRAKLRLVQGVPALDYSLEGRVTWAGQHTNPDARPLAAQLQHAFSYTGQGFHTDLSLDDERGRWVSLQGDVANPTGPLADLAALSRASTADWVRWLRGAGWNVALEAAPRAVDTLPALSGVPEVSGAELGLQLKGRREPHAAPVGTLAFQIAQTPRKVPRRGCSSRPLTTHGHLALQANRFGAALEAFDGQTRLLRAGTGGKLDVERWLDGEPPSWADLAIDVEATRVPLDGLPLACGRLRGVLTGSGTIRDPLGTLQLKADLAIARFSLGSDQTVDVDARVSVDQQQLALSGDVTAEGRRSPFEIRWPRANTGAAKAAREASIDLLRLPIAPFLPLEGPISHVSGYVSGQVRASATGGERQVVGSVRLEEVALTITELAQPLTDIGGELSFQNGALVLRRLTARDGDGELTLDGTLKLHGSRSFDGNFELVTRKFPLRQAGDVVAQTTATARIEMAWRPELHRLHVTLENFDTWIERDEGARGLSLEPHPDVMVKVRRPRTAAKAGAPATTEPRSSSAAAQVPLIVELDAAQQFWVKRADFALKLSANLRVATGEAKTARGQSDVNVTGQLQFERGYMEMLGKSFEVKRGGTLRFTGGTSAVLNLSAQYEDRRTDKLVLVQLQGSADAPKLEFQVDGRKVNAGEAFQAIYGSDATSDDVDPEAQANQIIGALMAGVLTTSMRRKLGAMAPILSVDPADENRGEQLRAGFELDALIPDFLRDIVTGIYVEGTISSEKQEDQAGSKDVQTGVLIELHFPYNLVSSGRYGPDTTWSLDLGWQP